MRAIRRNARSVWISGIESFIRPRSMLIAPIPMNRVSARSSVVASSARCPSMLCIRGRTTPPSITSSIPGRSTSTFATSRAFVITVSWRSTRRRANSRVVVPLPIAIVDPSVTRWVAIWAIACFASEVWASRTIGRSMSAAPPYVRTSRPWVASC